MTGRDVLAYHILDTYLLSVLLPDIMGSLVPFCCVLDALA
jgi:hypothetical protein